MNLLDCLDVLKKPVALFLILAATCGTAQALPPVPEIDPGTASCALAMLASGVFLFTSRRRK